MNIPDKNPYRKLPGRGGGFSVTTVRSKAYSGNDHLLLVTSDGFYSEQYKRFYYSDIQALVIQKTKTYMVINMVLGIIMLFLVLIAVLAAASKTPEMLVIVVPIFLLMLVFVISNLYSGTSCFVLIQTAVQREQLGNITNLKTAKKNLDILVPLILAAQGGATSPPSETTGEPAPPLVA